MLIEELKQLPKKDLHCHLSGSVPLETINRIVSENGILIPSGFEYPSDLFIKRRVGTMSEYLFLGYC
jgi:adenosine deaminase